MSAVARHPVITLLRAVPVALAVATVVAVGCASDPEGTTDPNASGTKAGQPNEPPAQDPSGGFGQGTPDGGPAEAEGPCPGGGWTSLTGTVFDPSGTVPLYNALVYIASEPLAPFSDGVTCDQCGTTPSGKPVATALTNAKGEFVLKNVPVGKELEFVVQIGRWRRAVKVPAVKECTTSPLGAETTRLPRSKAEGSIPKIAITTGAGDSLECFLRKLGIKDAEFTNPTGAGSVHLYQGKNPERQADGSSINAQTPDAQTLWSNVATLKKYDMVILACEGSENNANKSAYRSNIKSYLDAGGRVFASHYHYSWFSNGPAPLPDTGDWVFRATAGQSSVSVDTSFPRGMAMSDWLVHVGASSSPGVVETTALKESIDRTPASGAAPSTTRQWLYTADDKKPKFLSFNTPIGAAPSAQCGRGVFTDVHVSTIGEAGGTFPANCTSKGYTPQEKALLFLMMDLASCIQDDAKPPVAPPPVVK